MKEIIKKRWNRYKQFISIFYVFFTFMLCYATFFSSISDTGFRIMMKDGFKIIMPISVGSLLMEVIGAMLEFRQKSKKEKDDENQNQA
ncbi:MAG: hypothetical protein IJC97_02210 [Oscillospiraceae bacterium]|nr:hypothetical protein [Oscillospiraceae bacterium]